MLITKLFKPEENVWLTEFCKIVKNQNGRALLVGGFVRDLFLGTSSKDFDIEVYGLSGKELYTLLEKFGSVNSVGEQFTVYKLRPFTNSSVEFDISIPRRESKNGSGHKGFIIQGDPHMSFEEATSRRDFTMNAILLDPLSSEIIDPQQGLQDINSRTLRIVSTSKFAEDSLRVLRAAQFVARFELEIDSNTIKICQSVDLKDLPKERIWEEFEKLLLKSKRPSLGLIAMDTLGIISQIFPELKNLQNCPQEKEWHPEGDVWIHTLLCIDEAAQLISDLPKEKQITVMLATLAHDFGKPSTTEFRDGKFRSWGHDEAGVFIAENFLENLGIHTINNYPVRKQILSLVREHLRPGQFYKSQPVSLGAFRRLVQRVDPSLLYRVAKADSLGRLPPARSCHMQDWFINKIQELDLMQGPPLPLLQGRDLINLNLSPGPYFGKILNEVYEAQLEGTIQTVDQAFELVTKIIETQFSELNKIKDMC